MTLNEAIRDHFLKTLKDNSYNRVKTSKELDISVRSVNNYINKWCPDKKRSQYKSLTPNQRDNWSNRERWG